MISRRRLGVKRNAASSGITKVHEQRETLLDDLILEIDEHTEGERAEKDGRLEKEKKLVQAGEAVRNMALNRNERSAERTPDGDALSSVPKSSKT